MKNLKKLNRENLKNLNGGAGPVCSSCAISEVCISDCNGSPVCVTKGNYIVPNC
ncbi:bacteriocin-like protein [Chryseobacterium contaminans]|nr:hypothetical protein [Chryseobacterium contaminans]